MERERKAKEDEGGREGRETRTRRKENIGTKMDAEGGRKRKGARENEGGIRKWRGKEEEPEG